MKTTLLLALMLVTLTCSAQTKHEHKYLPTGEQLTVYPPIDTYKCDVCGDVKRVEQSIPFKAALINQPTRFEKYALWGTPTKLHISLPVDSFKMVQRKQYSYFLVYCKGYEVSMFVKPDKVLSGYLKRRM